GILNTTSSAQITVTQPAPPVTRDFSRVSVALNREQEVSRQAGKPLLLVAAVVLLMAVGAAFLSFRSRGTAPAANASAVASPTPAKVEPSPSPSPSPSPTASPKKEAKKQTNKSEKKESTGRKIL